MSESFTGGRKQALVFLGTLLFLELVIRLDFSIQISMMETLGSIRI